MDRSLCFVSPFTATHLYPYNRVILPLSLASKQADTNAIAITDAKPNLERSIKMEVISVNN